MKSIDFSKPGGFPLTQDQLDYLQLSYQEVIPYLIGFRNPGSNVAVRLSGMVIVPGATTTVSAGWFWYNGQVIYFGGGTWTSIAGGDAIYVLLTPTATSLTFNDGSTPGVILDSIGSLVQLVSSTADSATKFQLGRLQDFCRETNWTVETFASYLTGLGASGTIKYKKDYLSNTLQIIGDLTVTGAISLGGVAGYIDNVLLGTLMFTLPAGYRPTNRASFTVDINGSATGNCAWQASTDPAGWLSAFGPMIINNFVGTIETDGTVRVKFLNGGDPSVHTFSFAAVIPLD